MSKVAIITDSTSTLPKALIEKYHLTVLPQVVIWGEEMQRDGVDVQPTEFYKRLAASKVSPTTSQATVASFKDAYEKLHGEGYDILCILLSNKLSGTIGSAIQAKEMVPDAKVEVVDSLSVAMALGFQVIEVAKLAEQGAGLAECKALAEKAILATGIVLTPETLEYLHRGGRIGGGAKFLATALNIKPVLEVRDGRIEAVERVRTRKKALIRLVEIVEEQIGGRTPVRLSALHANSLEDAQFVMDEAKKRLNPIEAFISEVSPAIGTHTGPGTVGLVYMTGM
ncbi:MAG: DegV family protein [Anaerolineales bacterium]|nr:DegV family protein [Anaerolineales bacterium]